MMRFWAKLLAVWPVLLATGVLAEESGRPLVTGNGNALSECEPCKVESCRTPSSLECVAGKAATFCPLVQEYVDSFKRVRDGQVRLLPSVWPIRAPALRFIQARRQVWHLWRLLDLPERCRGNLKYLFEHRGQLAHLSTIVQADNKHVCTCTETKMVCGSDLNSYETICSLNEEAVRRGRPDRLTMLYWGPCKEAPVIVSKPEDSYGPLGANLTLDCEAKGHPAPIITWRFVNNEGKTISLPSK